jgi:hypothetical protein
MKAAIIFDGKDGALSDKSSSLKNLDFVSVSIAKTDLILLPCASVSV